MVKINGEEKQAAGMTVLDLLAEQGRQPERVAVMLNGDILPKSGYGREIPDGAEVEIVGFVGGG